MSFSYQSSYFPSEQFGFMHCEDSANAFEFIDTLPVNSIDISLYNTATYSANTNSTDSDDSSVSRE